MERARKSCTYKALPKRTIVFLGNKIGLSPLVKYAPHTHAHAPCRRKLDQHVVFERGLHETNRHRRPYYIVGITRRTMISDKFREKRFRPLSINRNRTRTVRQINHPMIGRPQELKDFEDRKFCYFFLRKSPEHLQFQCTISSGKTTGNEIYYHIQSRPVPILILVV